LGLESPKEEKAQEDEGGMKVKNIVQKIQSMGKRTMKIINTMGNNLEKL
jgi:hypothetical protein